MIRWTDSASSRDSPTGRRSRRSTPERDGLGRDVVVLDGGDGAPAALSRGVAVAELAATAALESCVESAPIRRVAGRPLRSLLEACPRCDGPLTVSRSSCCGEVTSVGRGIQFPARIPYVDSSKARMSITLQFDDGNGLRLTDETVERRPPDRIEFAVEGTLTVTGAFLEEFEGATLNPVSVTVSSGSESVEIDLTGPAALRLESVDVGIATPDEGLADGLDALRTAGDRSGDADRSPDVLAFTVDGTIRDVPTETAETLADESLALESLTFAVDGARSDGGTEPEALLELTLFGYGVTVRRDGMISVGRHDRGRGLGLP